MSETIYFNFPISILEGAFDDIKKVCDNIMDYAIYKHSLKLQGSDKKKMKDAASFFNLTLGNVEKSLTNGENLYSTRPTQIMASVNTDIVFDYYKEFKTEFEIACFCAYCSIKSIVGKQTYCKTNKDFIIYRMFGLSDNDKERKSKYSNRYHIDKILFELQENWGLNLYSHHIRGFYLSFTKELSELAVSAEGKKIEVRKSNLHSKKIEARKYAQNYLQHKHSTDTAP
jgi:hypothetical protein